MMEGLPPATPSVNYASMQTYIGKRVWLVGKIEKIEVGQLQVKTSDGATVTVIAATQGSGVYDTPYVQVLGEVVNQRTVREEEHINIRENFDLNMHNELVNLSTGRYQELFA